MKCKAGKAGWLCILAMVAASSSADAAERRMTLADFGAEISIDAGDLALSPDGSRIAVMISQADYLDNRDVKSLVLIDTATGSRLDVMPARTGISSPKWSPSGDRLSWLDRTQGGPPQIHVMSVEDRTRNLVWSTRLPQGIDYDYEWSPDGKSFAFLSHDEPVGQADHDRAFEVVDADFHFLANSSAMPSWLGLVTVGSDDARRVSSGPGNVKGFAWLAGGKSIAYAVEPGARRGGYEKISLRILDTTKGTQRVRLEAAQMSDSPLLFLLPASPTRQEIAFTTARGAQPQYNANGIEVISLAGEGRGKEFTAAVDRSFREMRWLPDGSSFVAMAADGTRDGVWSFSVRGSVRKLDLGAVRQLHGLTVGGNGSLAFIGREGQRPDEVYFMKSLDDKPKRLTRFNDALTELELGRVESVHWTLDGFEQAGVLVYPPGFLQGNKYPLVLNIHGGPMSTSSEGFDAFNQLLAAQGWLVFSPNYRGSRSLGNAFQSAVINDPMDGPTRDVMAGVEAVKALGIVAEDHLAVSGWSYGGYLTTWLAARYPVWRSAVAAAAVTDWIDNYSLSDINIFFGYGFRGSPWKNDNAAYYWRQSPLSMAHAIRTPTLILSTTGDLRVPVTQSYKLYRALKDNGVPVKFIAYAMGGHSPGDPVNRRDWHRRWMEWIREHFVGSP